MHEYANKLNVPLIAMVLKHNLFKHRDYRQWIEIVENIMRK